jgi:hypothetical protein
MTKDTCLPQDPELLRVFKVFTFRKSFELPVLYASHNHMQETIQINEKTIHQPFQTGKKSYTKLIYSSRRMQGYKEHQKRS